MSRENATNSQKYIDKSYFVAYNSNRDTKGGELMTQTVDISKIQLTDDTLTNIQIMAPLLSKEDQLKVYGMLFGILCRVPDSEPQKTA